MAVLACEGLLARVDTLVPNQVRDLQCCQTEYTYLGERLRAVSVVASVWLLLVVHSGMLLQ